MEEIEKKYNGNIVNISEFFKSRIAYTIEDTLKFIELSDFFDHIVRHDSHIEFSFSIEIRKGRILY